MKTGTADPIKRIPAFIALVIAAAVFFSMTVMPAQAKTKYYLPSKVTYYKYSGGKFVKNNAYSLTYNKKGHVIKTELSDGSTTKLKPAYYKSGRLKKITCPGGCYFAFNTNGRMTQYRNGSSAEKATYSGKRLTYYREAGDWYKFKYTNHTNGAIKKVEARYKENPADYIPEYALCLNSKGLITKETSNGGSTYKVTYKYDKKKRVSCATVYKGTKKMHRYYFSYKKARTTTAKSKYTAIINAYVFPYGPQSMLISVGGGYAAALTF